MTNKQINNRKRPTSITLIIIWMFLMVFRGISKLFDMKRFALNQQLVGESMALFNYAMDFLILIAFIFLIIFFIMRKKNSWKYFLIIITVLIVGGAFSIVYVLLYPEMLLSTLPLDTASLGFIFTFTIIVSILILLFYLLVGHSVYKNRSYFNK